jgi:hypothetical protein
VRRYRSKHPPGLAPTRGKPVLTECSQNNLSAHKKRLTAETNSQTFNQKPTSAIDHSQSLLSQQTFQHSIDGDIQFFRSFVCSVSNLLLNLCDPLRLKFRLQVNLVGGWVD